LRAETDLILPYLVISSSMDNLRALLPPKLRSSIRRLLNSNAYSLAQIGQDVWVYGEVFDQMRCGFFVDVGANDGVTFSNTFLLEQQYAWKGLCVEADPRVYERLTSNRTSTCINACVDDNPGFVQFSAIGLRGGIVAPDTDNSAVDSDTIVEIAARTLTSILDDAKAPNRIDYLSVDVEGAESRVFRGLDWDQYAFSCMTIERPSEDLRDALADHSYTLVKELPGLDAFFVNNDFLSQYSKNCTSYYSRRLKLGRWL
jgi:FkbM family methyltransferase